MLLVFPIVAQTADTTFSRKRKEGDVLIKSFVFPTVLIGTGLLTMGDKNYFSSHDTKNYLQQRWPNVRTGIDDYTVFVPAASVYGMNLIGIRGKNNFLDRSILYAFSTALANGVSLGLKHNVDYLRPDGSANNSFPSGHTTNAFVAAEFMHQEYKHLGTCYSIFAYTFAVGTGLMRMVNNRHWMSDVLVGAGLGMASTKVAYWAYPRLKEKFTPINKKHNYSFMLLPFYDARNGGGLVGAARF